MNEIIERCTAPQQGGRIHVNMSQIKEYLGYRLVVHWPWVQYLASEGRR